MTEIKFTDKELRLVIALCGNYNMLVEKSFRFAKARDKPMLTESMEIADSVKDKIQSYFIRKTEFGPLMHTETDQLVYDNE